MARLIKMQAGGAELSCYRVDGRLNGHLVKRKILLLMNF
jgi:hypothetical protein